MGSENLPGMIIDSLTALSQSRNAGNVALAQANTQAAMAFLDRAAATTRDNAQMALAESQQAIQSTQQELENRRIEQEEGRFD